MRKTLVALGLVAGLGFLVAMPAEAQDPCLATLAVFDPVVGATVTTMSKVAGARSVGIQNKSSSSDCYVTFGPESLTTNSATGWYVPAADFRIWPFGYGPNLGALKIACKSVGTYLHVEFCK